MTKHSGHKKASEEHERERKRERKRKNKWVQRQRLNGNFNAIPEDAPPPIYDRHPPAYVGPLKDLMMEWQVDYEMAMGLL